jgi:predicted phage tail protein
VEREKERHLKQIQPPPPQEPKPEKKTNWWDIGMGALQVVGGAAEVIAGVTTAVFTAPSVGGALLGAYMAVDGFYTMKSGVAQMMNGYHGEERYGTSHGLEEAFASAGALV